MADERTTRAPALPVELTERILTPALAIHLDRVRANVARVIELCGDVDRWRPHVKTSKIPAVFAELCRAGVRHFKVATTREALELLATLDREGVRGAHVLCAQPLRGPSLERLAALARAHDATRVAVLCEDDGLAEHVPEPLAIFVDVNPGMDRTGLPLDEEDAICAIAAAAGARFDGVHYYDGHLHDDDAEQRARDVHATYDRLVPLLDRLEREGISAGEVVTSGTPSFPGALRYQGFPQAWTHRLSPGTVVYHDLRTEELCPELELVPAAVVVARVLSHPTPKRITCDAGSKALAAEAGDPCAVALGHPELEAQGPNEEHLPFRVASGERLERGTLLSLFPRHVCPTVNLADEALLFDGGELVAVVPVAARGHELLPD